MKADISQIHREAHPKLVATLTRVTGDISLAEDVLQEAYLKALDRWQKEGIPDNPIAWLLRTARNAAVDHFRHLNVQKDKLPELTHLTELEQAAANEEEILMHPALRDDMLRLIFTCCHPALAMEGRVALCLKTICGLETSDIAAAFIVSESTMAQRLVRAKNKIRDAGIAYKVPEEDELQTRLSGVLAVVYLIFNEAYLSSAADQYGVRVQMANQAIRLTSLLRSVLTERSEADALLALMLLQHSRRDTRFADDNSLVLLKDQDRSRWYHDEIAEATTLLSRVFVSGGGETVYAIQAAIACTHANAKTFEDTDWDEICTLYEHLMSIDPSPIVALNHAVAIAERDGAERGLALLETLHESTTLGRYHLYHAARGRLLWRLDRRDEARQAFKSALGLTMNSAERKFLQSRLDSDLS